MSKSAIASISPAVDSSVAIGGATVISASRYEFESFGWSMTDLDSFRFQLDCYVRTMTKTPCLTGTERKNAAFRSKKQDIGVATFQVDNILSFKVSWRNLRHTKVYIMLVFWIIDFEDLG